MGFLATHLGRYLLGRAFAGIGLILAVVLATLVLFDVVEQMRTVGSRASISVIGALGLTLLRLPALAEATLPIVVLVGAMVALFGLNRRSELTAIRAAGVSAWSFLAPTMAAAALIGIVAATLVNPLGAALTERYERVRDELTGQARDDTGRAVWLRQGDEVSQIVITASGVDVRTSTLREPVFLVFNVLQDGALRFDRRYSAASATLRDGFWQLEQVVEATPGAAPTTIEALSIPTDREPDKLVDEFVSPTSLSFWTLPGFIAQSRAAGLTPTSFEIRWYSLLSLPLLLAAMAALGAAFSLRLQRLGGIALWAGLGLAAGTAVFFGLRVAAAFAITDVVPAWLAVLAPPVAGGFFAIALLSYLEDG